MKTKLPWILTLVLAIALGVTLFGRTKADPQAQHKAAEEKILYWVDPMHPAYKSDKPGTAPDCGMDLVPVHEGEAGPAGGAQSNVKGYSNVKLSTSRQQLIGVQTGVAETRNIGRSVRAVGRVAIDETRLHTITTKFDGYIEKLYVDYTGKEVRRGQPLFSVYSPELLATQQEYLLALRAAKQSPLLLESSRRRLQLWDIGAADISRLEQSGQPRKSLTIACRWPGPRIRGRP